MTKEPLEERLSGSPSAARLASQDGLGDAMDSYSDGDVAAAFEKFTRLAEQENLIAQYCVGWMHYTGKGAEHNFEKAAEWFHRAAEYGHDLSQSMLGEMYGEGKGVAKDYAESVKWLRIAAEKGIVVAQYNLGAMYENGSGVRKNKCRAYMLYSIAAAQGFKKGQKTRKKLAANMTPRQIKIAKRIAEKCRKRHYRRR